MDGCGPGEGPMLTSILIETIEEISPYSDWPIDAKVYVWNIAELKFNRHFAGVSSEGKPTVWINGLTSFTSLRKDTWDHIELADDEK